MRKNYPLWFTFWHLLGVRAQLSRQVYERA
jgi:hypothetical protein